MAGEFVDGFEMSTPAMLRHLNIPRVPGIGAFRSEALSLNPDGFGSMRGWPENELSAWSRRLDALERDLRKEDKPNERKRVGRASS
jgi:hypothetical protein